MFSEVKLTAALDDDADAETRAIVQIQRAYRVREAFFEFFAPNIFSTFSGAKAPHGKVSARNFPASYQGMCPCPKPDAPDVRYRRLQLLFEGSALQRPFISVSTTTSVPLLAGLLSKYWRLKRPEIIVTVTGGALDFQLTSSQLQSFETGLVSAVRSTNAWVITAGSDAGVMKLVGRVSPPHAQRSVCIPAF